MPPLRYLRHATGQRKWRITTCHCWHTPQSPSICFLLIKRCGVCHPGHPSWPNAAYYQLMQGLCSIGLRRCTPQSPANLIILLRGVQELLSGNGSGHLFQRERGLSWPQCTVQLDRNNLTMVNIDHTTGIPGIATPKAAGPVLRESHVCDPECRLACYWQTCRPLQQQRHLQLHNMGVYATPAFIRLADPCAHHARVLKICPDPEEGRAHEEQPTTSHHPASWPKRP